MQDILTVGGAALAAIGYAVAIALALKNRLLQKQVDEQADKIDELEATTPARDGWRAQVL